MHPAFSVIFLTTLIGAGQGLLLALYTAESYAAVGVVASSPRSFYVAGGIISLVLLIAGLGASFLHLGHPERAWRSASMWRTSWLSREVILLPLLMVLLALYTMFHYLGWDLGIIGIDSGFDSDLTLIVGAFAVLATFALFVSTAMIYACIKFIQEWASVLTVINYTLLGSASGFTLATALTVFIVPEPSQGLVKLFGFWAVVITVAALLGRVMSLYRNARLKPRSTVQSAIGIRHGSIIQRAQGVMGGSFNTREFFHNAPDWVFRWIRPLFLVLTFPLPIILIITGVTSGSFAVLIIAFVVQYLGLIAERWYFFAQAKHPQNIYYQYIS
ncbi:MAG: DMSO reductase [marine bacterium B5-7]|nr:MAG: DMSO reductase [marine bacterium B5-7]